MSDIPFGFEQSVAIRLRDLVRAPGNSQGGGDPLPEQRRVALAKAPSGGIPARSGTTPGSATCTFWEIATGPTLTATSISETVYNVSGTAVAANAIITVNREYITGKWIVIMESCEPA
jgi:hypothetical protein